METNQTLHKTHPGDDKLLLKESALSSLTFALKRHCRQHVFYVFVRTKPDRNPH